LAGDAGTLKVPDGAPLEEVLAEIKGIEGWKPGGATVRRLAEDAKCGDFVWNRDSSGAYWLGRITGPWRFDGSADASKWDLNNLHAISLDAGCKLEEPDEAVEDLQSGNNDALL
jgi:hypothetical protein